MGLGESLRCAVAAQADWDGAAPSFGANNLFPLSGESVEHMTELLNNPELGGHSLAGQRETGTQHVQGDLRRVLHYEGDEFMMARAFGTDTFASGGTAVNTHTLTMKAEPDTAFGFALDKGHADWVVAAAIPTGFSLSVQDGRVMVSYPIIGKSLDQNGSVTWGSVSEPTNAVMNHVLFRHGRCWIDDSSGSALSSSAEITDLWQDFTLNFTTGKAVLFQNGLYTVLPTRTGRKAWTGTITLGRHTDDNRVDDIIAKTLKKMRWVFTAASGGYVWEFHHVGVRIESGIPGTDGEGRRTQTVNFSCERVNSNPTGESDVLPYAVNYNNASDPSVS